MRRAIVSAALGLAVSAAFVVPAAPALAQTGGSGTGTVAGCGTRSVGQTFTCDLAGFSPNADVTKSVNGTGNLTGKANASGIVHFTIVVLSQTAGTLDDPVNVTLQCGTNTLAATGGGVTGSGTFTLSCPAVTVPAAQPTSNVAFTGANVLRWSLAAVALMGIGALFILGSRRRRSVSE